MGRFSLGRYTFAAALVVLNGLAAGPPTSNAGLDHLVFQRISEPGRIMAPVGEQPFGLLASKLGGKASTYLVVFPASFGELNGSQIFTI
jgi:hypothetical protein